MKQARRRTVKELERALADWARRRVGMFMAESRPGGIIKAWTEEVFVPSDLGGEDAVLEAAAGLIRHFGALRVEVAAGRDGEVRHIRVVRDF